MRLIIGLVIVSLLAVSCKEQAGSEDTFIVKVYDKELTREELNESIPSGLSYEDSTMVAEHYVQKWIMENLIYDRASRNIADKELVEQLVESYRRSLIVYQYREQMVNENLSREISAEEVWKYYSDNKDKFQLEKTLVRGLFLKLPHDAPDLPNLRNWVKSLSESSLKKIEKYCVQHAIPYDYVVDQWADWNELTASWSEKNREGEASMKAKLFIEESDDNYHYLFYITECLKPGDEAPFEYAEATVKGMLTNQRKADFLENLDNNLYSTALESGQIVFNNKENN